MSDNTLPAPAPAPPQPQWPRPSLVSIRDFNYTHNQPQWPAALESVHRTQRTTTTSTAAEERTRPLIARRDPLAARRLCTTCHFAKEACTCSRCAVCREALYRRHRHHCRSCWKAVCPQCYGKERFVHPLGSKQLVCDACAVPWALANLAKREDRGLFWGLYLLRRAGEMPCLCVAPVCRTLTYRSICYQCGTPTVMTQPHVERLLRVEPHLIAALDQVRILDAQERSLRTLAVDAATEDDVERVFRACFPRYEELTAFEGIHNTREGQWLLLSLVAASVAYEYHSAPDLTLALSDVPYARVLKLVASRPRYSVLECPGRVKFIAFPGTHNWRTRFVDLRISQEVKQSWTPLVEGVRLDPSTGEPVFLCGGLRQVWSYRVHGGFAQETREADVPLEQLAEDVRQGYRLVLSGHSLGGAVAQLVTVQLLSRFPELFPPHSQLAAGQCAPILCVTLGAPLVGNYQFVDRVAMSGWAPYFHNLVYHTDIVPRLSCGDELTWDAAARVTEQATTLYRNVQNWFTWRKQDEAAANRHDRSLDVDSADEATSPRTPHPDDGPGSPHSSATASLAAAATHAVTTGAGLLSTGIAQVRRPGDALEKGTSTLGSAADLIRSSAPQLAAQVTGTSLEDYVDASIRTGRVVLAEDEDVPRSAREAQAHVVSTLREAHHTGTHAVSTPRSCSTPSTPQTTCQCGAKTPQPEEEHERNRTYTEEEAAAVARVVSQEALRRKHRRYACLGRYHLLGYGSTGYISTAESEVAFALLKNGCGDQTRLIDHSVSSYNRGIMMQLYGKKE